MPEEPMPVVHGDPPTPVAFCTLHRENCRRFQDERDRRYASELRATHEFLESAVGSIKELITSVRAEALTERAVTQIFDARLSDALGSVAVFEVIRGITKDALKDPELKDLAKGTLTLPIVVSILASCIIIVTAFVTFKSYTEKDLQILSDRADRIERRLNARQSNLRGYTDGQASNE